jgi:RNA polymerase sigma-70 factor (ECF subfamily)
LTTTKTSDASEDTLLLQQIAEKNHPALKSFYTKFEKRIFNFAYSKLNDSFAASDILNEVMFEVWRNAHRFEGRSSVSSWVFGIAHNKSIDHIRKNSRHDAQELEDTIEDTESQSPEDYVEAADDASKVKECMSKLSDNHKSVMHLAFYEELTYSEIGKTLDCPENTIKTRIFHAKRALKHCLSSLLGRG